MAPDSFDQLETALKTGLDITDEQTESLSGLNGDQLARFRELWGRMEGDERASLLSRLGEASEENLVLDFSPIFNLGVDDPDPTVRELSYQLSAADAPQALLEQYLRAAVADSDPDVRIAAIEGLGYYTLTAQVDDWPADVQNRMETALVGVLHLPGADRDTRRAALLSLSFLTTPRSETEIRQAYLQPDLGDAAIEAMGRNCQEIWIPDLYQELEDDDAARRQLAAAALGELAVRSTVERLLPHLRDDDEEVQLAVIKALGEIGGSDAKLALGDLLSSRDRAVRDAARDAMEVLLAEDDPYNLS